MTRSFMHVTQPGRTTRVAITGGRGRLAQVIASFLRSLQYDVVLFSRSEGIGFQKLSDLFNPKILFAFEVIIHTAWSTLPFTSEEDQGREEREDFPLLKKLLASIADGACWKNIPRFIFFSSASVYGNTTLNPVTERDALHPISRYAKAKCVAEAMILQLAGELSSFQPLILRITNIVGLLSNPTCPQGILPRMIAAGRMNQTVKIWGDGHCSKDYLWVDDFLSAIEKALDMPMSGIFNIGSGENFSVIELLNMVEQAMNVVLKVTYHDRYLWDVAHAYVSSAKFSQVTGWKPQKNIPEEIKKLLA